MFNEDMALVSVKMELYRNLMKRHLKNEYLTENEKALLTYIKMEPCVEMLKETLGDIKNIINY